MDAKNKCIAVGSDHGGLALKYEILPMFSEWGWVAEDIGCFSINREGRSGLTYDGKTGRVSAAESVDYPDYAEKVVKLILGKTASLGLLICGTGIGMCISANKFRGIRAAVCSDPYSASMARQHNDANVLCIGGRILGAELAKAVVQAFLTADYAGGRHQRRIDKITQFEASLK